MPGSGGNQGAEGAHWPRQFRNEQLSSFPSDRSTGHPLYRRIVSRMTQHVSPATFCEPSPVSIPSPYSLWTALRNTKYSFAPLPGCKYLRTHYGSSKIFTDRCRIDCYV